MGEFSIPDHQIDTGATMLFENRAGLVWTTTHETLREANEL
jgi:hypothetical protein